MVLDRPSYRKAKEQQVQDFGDDLLSQVDQIHDPAVLKRLLIQKEQERLGLASNLDLAARLGLDLHQQIQQMEQDSYTKVRQFHPSYGRSDILLSFPPFTSPLRLLPLPGPNVPILCCGLMSMHYASTVATNRKKIELLYSPTPASCFFFIDCLVPISSG
jgi:hypothetical protein